MPKRSFLLALPAILLAGAAPELAVGLPASVPAAKAAAPTAQPQQTPRRADLVKRLEGNFAAVDANHDGAISTEELTASLTAAAKNFDDAAQKRRSAAFDRLDVDHNGQISRQEWAAMPGGRKVLPGNAGNDIAKLDKNGDQRLSLAEFSANALALFDRADTNHDGILQDNELKAVRGRGGSK